MGFDPQPNLWQCGPFALKHALVSLGILADEQEITSRSGAARASGTDEHQLARAARKFECDLLLVRRHDARAARQELVAALKAGTPCLVCVHGWSHWVTVVKEEQRKIILLDSRDEAVLTIVPWSRFEKMWVYRQRDGADPTVTGSVYDFHPLVPRFRVRVRAEFSVARARFLRRPENRQFARHWDLYLEDLLVICRPRTPLSSHVISLGEFLRRHGDMIVEQVSFWHGGIERRGARRILHHMHFVGDTYGLVIHEGDEKRAIAGITSILTLWAGGRYGVSPVYQRPQSVKAPRRG